MKQKRLDVLVCPVCLGQLDYCPEEKTLSCETDKLEYSIIDGIPVLIENEAKQISLSTDKVSM